MNILLMQSPIKFKTVGLKILYFGTPVALLTTLDESGNANIGPMSSVWALGRTLMLGQERSSKTYHNLVLQKECVINFPACFQFPTINWGVINMTPTNLPRGALRVGLGKELGKTFKSEI